MEDKKREYLVIARSIPTGTRNIDRMREDIHGTVSSVLGLVQMDVNRDEIDYGGERVDGYRWHIFSINHTLRVRCLYCEPVKPEIAYDHRTGNAIPLQHVGKVYERLGYFIESMYELFPELAERLKPVISAAGVNRDLFN